MQIFEIFRKTKSQQTEATVPNFGQTNTGYAGVKMNAPTGTAKPVAQVQPTASQQPVAKSKGLAGTAYDLAHKAARDYINKKSNIPQSWMPGPEDEQFQTPNDAAPAAAPAVVPAGTTATNAVAKTPEQIRKEKQTAAATTAQQQMAGKPATQPAVTPKLSTAQINQAIGSIRTRDLLSVKKNVDAVLAQRQKAPAVPNAMSNMAGQLTTRPNVSSTGGTTVATPAGTIHRAKAPAIPAAPVPGARATKSTKVSAPPPAGAPTSAEYANLEQRLQQAAAKGRAK
jgi:hypothetical protein